jgi:hypothetical protein
VTDPIPSRNPLILAAHPGHELLLYGWMLEARPRVCVLTDGSGHHAASRLPATKDLLDSIGATAGEIFGRFTDRQVYAALLEGRSEVVSALVDEMAEIVVRHSIDAIVADAMEGFNPVHDLCRIIAGAACDLAGRTIRRYEYPLHAGPPAQADYNIVYRLDDATLEAKLAAARRMSVAIPDVAGMLAQFGEEAFRIEPFSEAPEWTTVRWRDPERPLYERVGEERVADGRYDSVIRYRDHFQPLLDSLGAKRQQCAY